MAQHAAEQLPGELRAATMPALPTHRSEPSCTAASSMLKNGVPGWATGFTPSSGGGLTPPAHMPVPLESKPFDAAPGDAPGPWLWL